MDYMKLLLSMTTGATTGYVTNDYAVKMLFEKICGVGNVILQTKPLFIENVSKLIERDIINDRTIETELTKFESERVFYKIIADMLQQHLYDNTVDTEIRQIAGMTASMKNFTDFYERYAAEFCHNFLNTLVSSLDMDTVLGPGQRVVLAQNLWDIGIAVLQQSDSVKTVLRDVYCRQKDRKVGAFIHPGIFRAAAGNIIRHTTGLHVVLQANYSRDVDKTIAAAYELLEFGPAAKSLEASISDKTVFEVLGRENAVNIANEILQVIIELLKSAPGQTAVDNFARHMFTVGKSLNISLFDLLHEGMSQRLENYLREYLPEVLAKVISWIQVNKQELEELINQAVNDVLTAESDGFFNWRGKVKQTLKNVFYDDVAGKHDLVLKIIARIEESTDIGKLSAEVTELIITYLKQKSVSQMVTDMENRGILRPAYLAQLIYHNLDNFVAKINMAVFDSFFQQRLGSVAILPIAAYLEQWLQDTFIQQWKADYLLSTYSTKLFQREIKCRLQLLPEFTLEAACGGYYAGQLFSQTQAQLLAALRSGRTQGSSLLAEAMYYQYTGQKVSRLVNDDLQKRISRATARRSIIAVQDTLRNLAGQPVKMIYDRLNNRGTTGKELTGILIFVLTENLHILLEGKIQETVAANLQQLPDAQLQAMVKNFMGQELKPINRLGAGLGLGTGLLMYWGQGAMSVSNDMLNTLANMTLYGFTGYYTNVIALKMIFRPYHPWIVLGQQVPLTPGVVAKQKTRFAASMAEFVDKSLLSAASANDLFAAKRHGLEQNILINMSADNYRLPIAVLGKNSEVLSAGIMAAAVMIIRRNYHRLVDSLARELNEIDLAGLDYAAGNNAVAAGGDFLIHLQEWMTDQLYQGLQSAHSAAEKLPEFVLQAIYAGCEQLAAEKVQAAVNFLRDDRQVELVLQDWNGRFKQQTECSLQQLLTGEQLELLKRLAGELTVSKLQSPDSIAALLTWLEAKLADELHPDKQLADLFGGLFITLLRNNGGFILDSIMNGGLSWLQQNRSKLQRDMYRRFKDNNSWTVNLADQVLDIETTVYEVVDELIDKKLPAYLRRKHVELKAILQDFIDGKFAGTKVSELGLTMNAAGIASFVEQLLQHKNAAVLIKGLVENTVEFVVQLPLHKLLAVAGIYNLTDINRIFSREIAALRFSIADNLEKNQQQLKQAATDLLRRVVKEVILNIPVKDLARGITRDMLKQSVDNITAAFADSPVVDREWQHLLQAIVNEVKLKRFGNLFDSTMLAEDIIRAFEQTMEADKSVWDKTVRDMLTVIIDHINSIVTTEAKDYILQIAAKSFLDSVAVHFHSLVTAVNIKEITERQINCMTPEEIEAMFQSFAKPYFRKLELYGAILGALFGLVSSGAGKLIGVLDR